MLIIVFKSSSDEGVAWYSFNAFVSSTNCSNCSLVYNLQYICRQAFETIGAEGKYDVKANLDGGGISGQAEALRMGIARALCEVNAEDRGALKAKGLLRRDPRMVERKKPGQKKARKRFQFSKR